MTSNLRRLARGLFLVAVLLSSGCMPADNQSMEPNTHLPGFDLWMPKGVVVKHVDHPAVGVYQVRSGSAFPALPEFMRDLFPQPAPSTKVSWHVERMKYDEPVDMAALFDGALQGIATNGKGQVRSAGEGRWVSTYEFGKGKLVLGYARCEPWLTVMFIVGLEGDVRDPESALRIVSSLRCRIDEDNAPSLQVALQLPEHFGLAAATDTPTYFSTSGMGLVTNFTNGDIARDPVILEKVFGGMFAAALNLQDRLKVSTTPVTRPDGARSTLSTLRGDLGELGEAFEIGTLYCPNLDMSAMLIIMGSADPRTSSLDLVKSLRCPQPDSVAVEYPTIDTVFSAACGRGELPACERLVGFIESGNAEGSVMSNADARAKACSLGGLAYCAAL